MQKVFGVYKNNSRYTLVVSLTIELVQLFLEIGQFEICDLIHNVIGGVLGALLYYCVTKATRKYCRTGNNTSDYFYYKKHYSFVKLLV